MKSMTKEQILGSGLIQKMKEVKKNEGYFDKLNHYAFEELSDFERMVFYIGQLECRLKCANHKVEVYKQKSKNQQQKVDVAKKVIKELFNL